MAVDGVSRVFVGRRGGLVWVEGEPGIGKSAVVVEGLADAEELGCAVFHGSADQLRARFPLGVILDCLGLTGARVRRCGARSPGCCAARMRPREALKLLTAALTAEAAHEPPESYWQADLVRCALAAGDQAAAEAAAIRCETDASRHGSRTELTAVARWCRGLVDADRALLEQAVAYHRTVNRPLVLGQVLEDLAVARASDGDIAAARSALREATAIYLSLGAGPR